MNKREMGLLGGPSVQCVCEGRKGLKANHGEAPRAGWLTVCVTFDNKQNQADVNHRGA